MSGPFFDRLRDYYAKVGDILRGHMDAAAIFPNPVDVGTAKEKIYAKVLEWHIPASCCVFLGGFVYNIDGEESKQIDVIVTNNICPQYRLLNQDGEGKSFACVEGTIAAVSLKSYIDSPKLFDALDNLASIPSKRRLDPKNERQIQPQISEYYDWPFKIIYAPNGVSEPTLREAISTFYDGHPSIPISRRPNLIHIADQGYSLFRSGSNYYPNLETDNNAWSLNFAFLNIQRINHLSLLFFINYWDIINNLGFEDKLRKLVIEQARIIKERNQETENHSGNDS
jgi:hypothetical protein